MANACLADLPAFPVGLVLQQKKDSTILVRISQAWNLLANSVFANCDAIWLSPANAVLVRTDRDRDRGCHCCHHLFSDCVFLGGKMKESLLVKARKVRCIPAICGFFDKLPVEDQEQIREVVDAYLSGSLSNFTSYRDIYRFLLAPNGYKFSQRQFTDWVTKYAQTVITRTESASATTGSETGDAGKVGKRRQHPRTAERGT